MRYESTLRREPFSQVGEFDEDGLFQSESPSVWAGEINRQSLDYVRWVQFSLNKLLGLRLAVDGKSGPATRSAVRRFQQQRGLTADGIVGAMTEQALIRAGAGNPPSYTATQPAAAPLPLPSGQYAGYLKDLPELQTVNLQPVAPLGIISGWPSTRKTVAAIYNRLGGLMAAVARKTQVEISTVLAVWKVESGNLPHAPGNAIIRFENHKFYRRWGTNNDAVYAQYFRHGGHRGQSGNAWESHQFREDPNQPFRPFHGDQDAEYRVLRLAARLAGEEIALQCISIGGPQILVENYALIGYRTPRAMYDAFQSSERIHVLGFFDYCQQKEKEKGGLLPYLRARDFRSFARYYNGPGQVDYYGGKIQEAYNEARQLSVEQSEIFESEDDDMEWWDEWGEWEDEITRGSPAYVAWVQSSLNNLLGLHLAVDGIAGPATRSAVRRFQHQQALAADGIVGAMTEAALLRAGATAPPGGSAAPAYPQVYPQPPAGPRSDRAIEALNLAEPARSGAYKLKARHPWVVFTSGRRDLAGQARAMAGNVVKNRKWIVQTYVASPVIAAVQQWVDKHPEARTQQAIADGLLGVFQSFPASEIGRISRHLVGLAFDIQPVVARLSEIEPTIRSLPGMTKFLTKEGGLTIWHVQF